MGIAKEQSSRISMEQHPAAFYTLDKLSPSTQLDVHSPSPLNLPVGKCYAQLPSPNVAAETQLLPFVQRSARSGCSSWLSFIIVVIQAHACELAVRETMLYENLTFRMWPVAVVLNYSVNNNTERHTPDNNNNNIYIYI